MKKTKKNILSFCLLVWGATNLFAQNNAVASGNQATGAGGTASYSVGQIDYISNTGSGGTITEGLQQPYEILVITGIKETGIDLVASVYPNPATEFVTLKVINSNGENFTYLLYDLQGKILATKKVESNETNISMVDLTNATYFIKVLKNNNEVKQFKIIKN